MLTSEARIGWTFAFRWRWKLFLCYGCGAKMRKREGLLTHNNGKIQWACLACYHSADRRAAT